ncbi:MAG TPA: serine O-acetyltransferase, partial [Cellvibrio sp.]
MQIPAHNFAHVDVWQEIRAEAQQASADEPVLASFYHASILNHATFAAAISFHLANKLDSQALPAMMLREVFTEAMQADISIEQS